MILIVFGIVLGIILAAIVDWLLGRKSKQALESAEHFDGSHVTVGRERPLDPNFIPSDRATLDPNK